MAESLLTHTKLVNLIEIDFRQKAAISMPPSNKKVSSIAPSDDQPEDNSN